MKHIIKFRLNHYASSLNSAADHLHEVPDFVQVKRDPEEDFNGSRGNLVDVDEGYVAVANRPFQIKILRKVHFGEGEDTIFEYESSPVKSKNFNKNRKMKELSNKS